MISDFYFERNTIDPLTYFHKSAKNAIINHLVDDNYQVAFVGIPISKNSYNNAGCRLAPDEVRKYLYALNFSFNNLKITDLGNIKEGIEIRDSYSAVRLVTEELLENHILPIFIGGSQDFTFPIFEALRRFQSKINVSAIDSRLDLGVDINDFNAHAYWRRVMSTGALAQLDIVGTQAYLLDNDQLREMSVINYENLRLGAARARIVNTEVIFRGSDFISVDMGAVRQNDNPAYPEPMPNGFLGEELCQMMRYAGLSDNLKLIGFFEMNPEFDQKGQSAALMAQAIWYLLDGLDNRFHDYPLKSIDEYEKIIVEQTFSRTHEMVFYRNSINGRYWAKIPRSDGREDIIPCSYDDFLDAKKDFIPHVWERFFMK